MKTIPNFGDVFYVKLKQNGHIQGGDRPAIIIQNNIGNKYSPTVNIIPLSTKIEKAKHLPMHVNVYKADACGLDEDSVALVEQIQTINKSQLINKVAVVSRDCLKKIKAAHDIQYPFPV